LAIAAKVPNYGVLAKIPAEDILQRIADGTLPVDIASELGVNKSAISVRFAGDPRYKQAREIGMEVLLDQGLAEIEAAGDDLNLARAREILLRRREWRAERDFPHRWGQHTQVTVSQGDLGERLRRARERVIDAAPQQSQDIGPVKSTNA